MKYYLHDGEERHGPFSFAELKAKSITKSTPIWREGLDDWTKAGLLDELSSFFVSVPPSFKKKQLSVNSSLGRRRVVLAVFITIAILAWMTNPNAEQHKAMAAVKLNGKIEQLKKEIKPKKKFWKVVEEVTFALSSGALQQQINRRVWSDDYYLCSLTKVRLRNRDITVGFGAFGNVWLFTDVVNGIDPMELID
jgi:hypothetical protein